MNAWRAISPGIIFCAACTLVTFFMPACLLETWVQKHGPVAEYVSRPLAKPKRTIEVLPENITDVATKPVWQSATVKWPFQRDGLPDVWLHWAPPELSPWEQFRYQPLYLSFGEAFWSVGASVARSDRTTEAAMLKDVDKALALKRVPVLVVVGFYAWWKRNGDKYPDDFGNRSRRGAFLALYQSEQLISFGANNIGTTLRLAKEWQANEVWDYAYSNLEILHRHNSTQKTRYMPPGCSRVMDVGVGWAENSRPKDRAGWLGERGPPAGLKLGHFAGQLQKVGGIGTWSSLQGYLSNHDVHVNFHRTNLCCPSKEPVESFRVATYASNHRCTMSQRSHPLDENAWRGAVHFATGPNMSQLYKELRKDARGCQAATAAACRERLTPLKLLLNSGLLEELPAGWPRSPRR